MNKKQSIALHTH